MIHTLALISSIPSFAVLLGVLSGTAIAARYPQSVPQMSHSDQIDITVINFDRTTIVSQPFQAKGCDGSDCSDLTNHREPMQTDSTGQTGQFQQIDQPQWVKSIITVGGLGLIGLELWWFLLSQPKSHKLDGH